MMQPHEVRYVHLNRWERRRANGPLPGTEEVWSCDAV
jgi:hypothetical protein